MKAIKKLGVVINAQKREAAELANKLTEVAEAEGVAVKSTTDYPVKSGFLQGQDACCVLGGDGTILGIVPESIAENVPVFGINRGKLGFLATLSAEEAMAQFSSLLAGNYKIVQRSVIECNTANGCSGIALNDVVVKSSSISRLISLKVFSEDEWINEYSCDGLIFCTPTGSTAYNLSAGGPIVTPGSGIITMTPICPHSLTNRSVVFAHNTRLRIESQDNDLQPHFSLDGKFFGEGALFPVELSIKTKMLSLLQPTDYSYYKILRSKLKWGEDKN